MRRMKFWAVLLAAIFGLGYLMPGLLAQNESREKQESSNEKERENKKSEEGRGGQQGTGEESQSKPLVAYRAEFAITEFADGKKSDSRTYSLVVQQGIQNKLRIGGRLPVASGTGGSFSYLDIGTNIDCTVKERDGSILLSSAIDLASMGSQRDEQTHQPVIHQIKWDLKTILSPGKPTVVSVSDDPTSKGRFQVEVTVTRIR